MAKKNPKKNNKVIRYRRPLNINIGMIIFALIFVYMGFSVYTYIKREKIQFYEVVDGGIVNDRDYTGIILRDEEVQYTSKAGTINYYVGEGRRAAVGTTVYSIDEENKMTDFLNRTSDGQSLSSDSLSAVKRQLSAFNLTFDEVDFGSVYDIKYSLESLILEYSNFDTADSLAAMEEAGIRFTQVRSEKAGIVSYTIDTLEDLEASQVEESLFDRSSYPSSVTRAGEVAELNEPVYKLVVSDDWSIVFPLTEEDIEKYGAESSLKVSFRGRDLTTTGSFSMITGADGKPYGKLDFNKYMIQFVSERYVDFEIVSDKVDGLKIPISAVTTKDFFLVPLDYLTRGGDSSDTGFLKEVYSGGESSMVFTPATLYYATDEYYYIERGGEQGFQPGDYLIKPESTDRYQLGTTASLKGVYNINKGYAVFKQIEVLTSNDEYCTVKKNMDYGLSVYDHIVLDAETVEEGKLIYQ